MVVAKSEVIQNFPEDSYLQVSYHLHNQTVCNRAFKKLNKRFIPEGVFNSVQRVMYPQTRIMLVGRAGRFI